MEMMTPGCPPPGGRARSSFLSCPTRTTLVSLSNVVSVGATSVLHPANMHSIDANHRFTPRQPDWGFKRFADMTKLLQTKDNKPSVIQDGKTVISVFVQVLDDPTGVLWDDFVEYAPCFSLRVFILLMAYILAMTRRKPLDSSPLKT